MAIRIYLRIMNREKNKGKRKVRTYKILDAPYRKAMKKAKKNKTTVANLLEDFLYDYAE